MKKIMAMGAAAVLLFAAAPAARAQLIVKELLSEVSLIQAIDTLYATYDHINATIENVRNTYQQLERQIKAMQNINFDDFLKLGDVKNIRSLDDFSEYRHTIENAVSNVNANMNYINAIQDTLSKRVVTFGGQRFTVASLFGFGKEGEKNMFDLPKVAADYMMEQGKTAAAGWANKLTYEQRERLMDKYGMSARNFAAVTMARNITDGFAKALFGYADEAIAADLAETAKRNEQLKAEMDAAMADGSYTAQIGVLGESLSALGSEVKNLGVRFSRISSWQVSKAMEEALVEESKTDAAADEAERKRRQAVRLNGANSPYLRHPRDDGSLDWLR
jgi:hypothetical protein